MAKLKKSTRGTKSKLEIVHPRCAGIDVGSSLMQVCISVEDEVNGSNRAFGTTTQDLRLITDWLHHHRITHVAMEATGVYWMPLFNMLTKYGITAVLLNAADVKNYTARKTDVNDAEWLMTLMSYDIVKPSFQIDDLSRSLKNCTRHRSSLVSLRSDCIRRIQKTLELMNIKLTGVLTDIVGDSGIKIIEAIIDGCTDHEMLASYASSHCKKSKAEIALALEGTWNEELIFILRQIYSQYKSLSCQICEIDTMIKKKMDAIAEEILSKNGGVIVEVGQERKRIGKQNRISFDIEYLAAQIWGVNLMKIDGISAISVLSLMGELGSDFTKEFKDAAHFCSWCNLSPNDKISAGKILSSHRKKGTNPVGLILRNCAQPIANSKSIIGDYYRRMRAKGGGKYAVCATAHKLATIIYTMVKNKTEYDKSKVSISDEELIKKRILRYEQTIEKLKKRIA